MTPPPNVHDLKKWRNICWAVGAAFALLCLLGALQDREQFFRSYLFSYLYWFGMGIGCLGILLLHQVTGGAWGELIRPALEAGARTLPGLALLFLPILFGLRALYPWA